MDEDEKEDRKPSSSSSSSADNVAAPADAQVEAKHPPPPPPPPKRAASRSGGLVAESRGSETVALKPAPWYAALPTDMIIAAYVIFPGAPRREIESMLTDSLAHVSIVLTPGRDEMLMDMFTQLRSGREMYRHGWEDLLDKKVSLATPSDSMHIAPPQSTLLFQPGW